MHDWRNSLMMRRLGDDSEMDLVNLYAEATTLALELAKWYTPDKTEDDALAFLKSKTSNETVLKMAVSIWLDATWRTQNEASMAHRDS